MAEQSQTNANAPTPSQTEETDNQGSPASAENNAPKRNTTTADSITNEIIEVTEEDSFDNDAPPTLDDGDTNHNDNDDDDDDSAVEIIDAPSFREQQHQLAKAAAASASTTNNGGDQDSDEELQCVGTANETKLPHNRQDCLEFRYNNSSNTTNSSSCCADTTVINAKFCQLCYCYVCDKPASECNNWYLGEKGVIYQDGNGGPPQDKDQKKQSSSSSETTQENTTTLQLYNNHCNATDKGVMKNYWKNMRSAIKNGQDPSAVMGNATTSNPTDDSLAQYLARYTVPTAASTNNMTAMLSGVSDMAEELRQRQRERHRHRAHATGQGGAYQRSRSTAHHRDGGEENYSSIYGSVSMDAANAMDFSSTITSSSRSSRAPRQERRRRTRPAAAAGGNGNEQRSRHSNHRDRMRTQEILEDLYS